MKTIRSGESIIFVRNIAATFLPGWLGVRLRRLFCYEGGLRSLMHKESRGRQNRR